MNLKLEKDMQKHFLKNINLKSGIKIMYGGNYHDNKNSTYEASKTDC